MSALAPKHHRFFWSLPAILTASAFVSKTMTYFKCSRFTLRAMLLVVLVFAVALASEIRRLHTLRDAEHLIEAAGGSAGYEARFRFAGNFARVPSSTRWNFCNELTDIYLGHSQVSDRDMHAIGRVLTVEYLDLNSTTIGDIGLDAVVSNHALRSIDLSNTAITDSGLKSINRFINLRVLSLDGTAVSDAGIQALSELVQISDLSLDNTAISNNSIHSLLALPTLTHLSLRHTGIDDSAITSLCHLRLLTFLDLTGTKVTQLGISELASDLPECIIWLDADAAPK
jgi:hypothetical protein